MLDKILRNKGQKQLLLFVIKAIAIYSVWFVVYDFYISPQGKVDQYLNYIVALHTSYGLDLIGYNGGVAEGIEQTLITIDNKPMVGVGNPCNGLELFVLFAGFIICFPGQIKLKVKFIAAGILGIYVVNVIRTTILSLIQLKSPEHLDFNHHYTFTIIVYSFIFALWIRWVNKYSGINSNEKK